MTNYRHTAESALQTKLIYVNHDKGYGFVEEFGTGDRYFIHVKGRRQSSQVSNGVQFVPVPPSFDGMNIGDSIQILEVDQSKPADKLAALAWIPSSETVLLLYAVISVKVTKIRHSEPPICDNERKLYKEVITVEVTKTESVVFVGTLEDCRNAASKTDWIQPLGGGRRFRAVPGIPQDTPPEDELDRLIRAVRAKNQETVESF